MNLSRVTCLALCLSMYFSNDVFRGLVLFPTACSMQYSSIFLGYARIRRSGEGSLSTKLLILS